MNWQDSTEWVLPPGSDEVEAADHFLTPEEEENRSYPGARTPADQSAGLPFFASETPEVDLLSEVSTDADAGAGNGAFCA